MVLLGSNDWLYFLAVEYSFSIIFKLSVKCGNLLDIFKEKCYFSVWIIILRKTGGWGERYFVVIIIVIIIIKYWF